MEDKNNNIWDFNYDPNGKIKCYFGCGHEDWHDKGYINVDIRPASHVDVQCDLSRELPIADEYADEIVAWSLLEHFPMGDYKHDDKPYANTLQILREWRRILKPGGMLELKVPNICGLANGYLNNKMDIIEYFRYIYGGQNYPENTHIAGFDKRTMTLVLTLAGFGKIEYIHSHSEEGSFDELNDWEMRCRTWK